MNTGKIYHKQSDADSDVLRKEPAPRTALVKATHAWLVAEDVKQRTMARVLLTDMSEAFGRVNHAPAAAANIELTSRLLAWVHSLTTGRRQRFLLNGSTQRTVRDNTPDSGYANDIGLSQAVPLTNIYSVTLTAMEAGCIYWVHLSKCRGFHLDSDLSGDTHTEQVNLHTAPLSVSARHGSPFEDGDKVNSCDQAMSGWRCPSGGVDGKKKIDSWSIWD